MYSNVARSPTAAVNRARPTTKADLGTELSAQRPWALVTGSVIAAYVMSVLLRFWTYDSWADGDWQNFGAAASFWSCAALVIWLGLRAQLGRRSPLPWLAAIGVMIPFDAVHYARVSQRTWIPEMIVADTVSAAASVHALSSWEAALQPGATVQVEQGRIVLTHARGAAGYLEFRTPPLPGATRDRTWLPRGALRQRFDERIEWNAQVERAAPFYELLHAKGFSLQATSYGLKITYQAADGGLGTFDVETSLVNDGALHHYVLERRDGVIRLRLDDVGAWVRPDAGPWGFVRFGDGQADDSHGGRHAFANVRYLRTYVADDA
ncbi:MAG: hypothetical protein ACR2NO_01775 [Chloroflexota bacterium]